MDKIPLAIFASGSGTICEAVFQSAVLGNHQQYHKPGLELAPGVPYPIALKDVVELRAICVNHEGVGILNTPKWKNSDKYGINKQLFLNDPKRREFGQLDEKFHFIDKECESDYIKARIHCEESMLEFLDDNSIELIGLAGWDRIFYHPQILNKKIFNIHPALISEHPEYLGTMNAYKMAYDSGDKVYGCTTHLVTAECDLGQKILQTKVERVPGHTLEQFIQYGKNHEYPTFLATTWLFATGCLGNGNYVMPNCEAKIDIEKVKSITISR